MSCAVALFALHRFVTVLGKVICQGATFETNVFLFEESFAFVQGFAEEATTFP